MTIDPETITVFFEIYYKDDVDYTKTAYGTLRLYHREDVWQEVKLTAGDRRGLSE